MENDNLQKSEHKIHETSKGWAPLGPIIEQLVKDSDNKLP